MYTRMTTVSEAAHQLRTVADNIERSTGIKIYTIDTKPAASPTITVAPKPKA